MRQLFVNTVLVSTVDNSVFRDIRPGQWIKTEMNQRGQYLGLTDSGAVVIRWQNSKFAKRDAKNNKHLRNFAKVYGSK